MTARSLGLGHTAGGCSCPKTICDCEAEYEWVYRLCIYNLQPREDSGMQTLADSGVVVEVRMCEFLNLQLMIRCAAFKETDVR